MMSQSYGPYSSMRQVGGLFFVSGQVGIDPETKTASPDIAIQVGQALKNLHAVLAHAELELTHVVKTTVFLTDIRNFVAVNEVYEKFFAAPRPARSTVAIV